MIWPHYIVCWAKGLLCRYPIPCALWPWPWRYMTFTQDHDTPLGHGQLLCNISSISNMVVRSYSPDPDVDRVHCYLDLRDVTFIQGHDTPLRLGKQLFQISRSNIIVRSYGPDTGFATLYECTWTLTVKIWSSLKVLTYRYSWVMDNNCLKYYPDPTRQWKEMARTHILAI